MITAFTVSSPTRCRGSWFRAQVLETECLGLNHLCDLRQLWALFSSAVKFLHLQVAAMQVYVCVNLSFFHHGVYSPGVCWTRQVIMMPFDKGSVVTMRRQGGCLISQGHLMWQSPFSRGYELLKDKDYVMGVDTFQGLVLLLSMMLDTFEQLDNLSILLAVVTVASAWDKHILRGPPLPLLGLTSCCLSLSVSDIPCFQGMWWTHLWESTEHSHRCSPKVQECVYLGIPLTCGRKIAKR